MSRFTLTAIDGGRLILSTEEPLRADEYENVRQAVDAWKKTTDAILIIADCVVRRSSRDLELEIEPARAIPYPSAAEVRHERLLESPYERELADERHFASLRTAQADPANCSNCGGPLATHTDCGEFG